MIADSIEVLKLDGAIVLRGEVDVLMDAMFGRKACLRELERALLRSEGVV